MGMRPERPRSLHVGVGAGSGLSSAGKVDPEQGPPSLAGKEMVPPRGTGPSLAI